MSQGRRPSRARGAALVAALCSLSPLAAGGDDSACKTLCHEGRRHFDAGEFEQARDCYAKAVEADHLSALAQEMYGDCLASLAVTTKEQKATFDQAFVEWEKVLKLDCEPYYKAAACNELAHHHSVYKNDDVKALEWYEKGVALAPKVGALWLGFGRWYSEKKDDVEAALECCKKALECQLSEAEATQAREDSALYKELLSDPSRKKKTAFSAVVPLPSLGGLATSADRGTLVGSVPTTAELVYIDAAAGKETKRVSLEFQPGRLAVQGKALYATARGASKLYALDLESGKVEKTWKLPSSPLVELCCHRSKGLLYGTTAMGEVLSIDPATGRVTTCKAKGEHVAIDPSKGSALYVAAPADAKKPEGKTVLRKYAVAGSDLRLVDTNEDAGLGGRSLEVSTDGKLIAVAGEGGAEDKAEGTKAGAIAFFETEKITTAAGRLDLKGSPRCLAFHPFLEIGVAVTDKGIVQFHARSLVHQHAWPSPSGPDGKEPRLVAFVDGGKKLACWEPGDASKNVDGKLGFLSLQLTDDDTAALEKARGKKD